MTVNVENFNKLIEWVKTRETRTAEWANEDQCLVGMITTAFDLDHTCGPEIIHETLGIECSVATDLYILYDTHGTENHQKRFEHLSLEAQNAVLVATLENLRDTDGETVRWIFPEAA